MKTIIAPTDFSKVSINAVNYAADMAVSINAELLLLHAAELPLSFSSYGIYDAEIHNINREDELDDLKKKILQRTGNKIRVKTQHVMGSIELEIREECLRSKPFAVVMATHRPGIFERLFLGSITMYTARYVSYPVLVVPDGATFKPIKKVLLASDFKTIYGISLNELESITTTLNASLDVLHVRTTENETTAEESLMKAYLKTLNPTVHVVYGNDVEKSITTFADENQIDLLLILPKKHGTFHKSISEEVMFRSPVPAMSIHEGVNS